MLSHTVIGLDSSPLLRVFDIIWTAVLPLLVRWLDPQPSLTAFPFPTPTKPLTLPPTGVKLVLPGAPPKPMAILVEKLTLTSLSPPPQYILLLSCLFMLVVFASATGGPLCFQSCGSSGGPPPWPHRPQRPNLTPVLPKPRHRRGRSDKNHKPPPPPPNDPTPPDPPAQTGPPKRPGKHMPWWFSFLLFLGGMLVFGIIREVLREYVGEYFHTMWRSVVAEWEEVERMTTNAPRGAITSPRFSSLEVVLNSSLADAPPPREQPPFSAEQPELVPTVLASLLASVTAPLATSSLVGALTEPDITQAAKPITTSVFLSNIYKVGTTLYYAEPHQTHFDQPTVCVVGAAIIVTLAFIGICCRCWLTHKSRLNSAAAGSAEQVPKEVGEDELVTPRWERKFGPFVDPGPIISSKLPPITPTAASHRGEDDPSPPPLTSIPGPSDVRTPYFPPQLHNPVFRDSRGRRSPNEESSVPRHKIFTHDLEVLLSRSAHYQSPSDRPSAVWDDVFSRKGDMAKEDCSDSLVANVSADNLESLRGHEGEEREVGMGEKTPRPKHTFGGVGVGVEAQRPRHDFSRDAAAVATTLFLQEKPTTEPLRLSEERPSAQEMYQRCEVKMGQEAFSESLAVHPSVSDLASTDGERVLDVSVLVHAPSSPRCDIAGTSRGGVAAVEVEDRKELGTSRAKRYGELHGKTARDVGRTSIVGMTAVRSRFEERLGVKEAQKGVTPEFLRSASRSARRGEGEEPYHWWINSVPSMQVQAIPTHQYIVLNRKGVRNR